MSVERERGRERISVTQGKTFIVANKSCGGGGGGGGLVTYSG